MRKIKGSITITNNATGKHFVANNKDVYRDIRKMKAKFAAMGIAVGIGLGTVSTSVISDMANNANNAQGIKEAIEIAASTEEYLNDVNSNDLLQDIISQEELTKIEELSSAITTYKKLRYEQERILREEKEYIEACETISKSREMVMSLYTDTIKAKIAEAYGIEYENDIEKMEVVDYIQDNGYITKHTPQIILHDGTVIEERNLLSKNTKMDNALAQHIINARSLSRATMFSENKKIKDLQLDTIIDVFEKAKEFEKCTMSVDKKGNIRIMQKEEIQENKSQEENLEEENNRDSEER